MLRILFMKSGWKVIRIMKWGLICLKGVLEHKADSVEFRQRELHINDPEFADEIVAVFERLMETGKGSG